MTSQVVTGKYDVEYEVPNGRCDTSSQMSNVRLVKLEVAVGRLILLDETFTLASKPHASLDAKQGT